MDEIELIERVRAAIEQKGYLQLLDLYENKLIAFMSQYSSDDIFILINKIIFFHNKNMIHRLINYDKYDKNKHISLRMLLSLPLYYYKNVVRAGCKSIIDYEEKAEEMIKILKELELIYYYYPCRNQSELNIDEKTLFYMNYFKTYYFDIPEFQQEEFLEFICDNEKLCEEVLEDPYIVRTLNTAYYLQNFEDNIYSLKKIKKYICKKYYKVDFEKKDLWESFPINFIRFLMFTNKLNFNYFLKKYTYDVTEYRQNVYTRIIDAIDSDDRQIAMKNAKSIFFPRNYYWIYRWYNNVWHSSAIRRNIGNGNTYKSEKHEKEIKIILETYFGNDNVFSNIYLKRRKGEFAEKDFIVLCNDYVISLEAKSRLLPAPYLGIEDGIEDIKSKYEESIEHAVKQGKEIGEAISLGKAVFYNSNKKGGKQVLDLNNYSQKKFIQIAITYESFLNLETNVEYINTDQSINFWFTDVKSLEYILADTVGKGEGDKFIEYVQKRINAYGMINVQSGEELKIYNFYKSLPLFFEGKHSDMGISIHI